MALGGGKWLFQNKILPGTYINVVSGGLASVKLTDRGIAAIPIELSWGPEDELFKVDAVDFLTDTNRIFGYNYGDDEMLYVREIFENAKTVYFYKLNKGVKAENELAKAKYGGSRGNDLSVVVTKDLDSDKFSVETLLDNEVVDKQVVKSVDELENNDYLEFIGNELEETAGMKLDGGEDGEVDAGAYQKFLDKVSTVSINTLGCPSSDETIKKLFFNYTKRMRDEVGAFFQTVIHDEKNVYDHEGMIVIPNKSKIKGEEFGAVYYYTGANASCPVNESLGNKIYTGELEIESDYSQTELSQALEDGLCVLHEVDGQLRVLNDINSFISVTEKKQEEFGLNQVVRVFDGIGLEMALVFNNKYNGHVPNDDDGRISLWSDFDNINKQYSDIRAINSYSSDDLQIAKGKGPGDVVVNNAISITTAMTHLYATIIIKE